MENFFLECRGEGYYPCDPYARSLIATDILFGFLLSEPILGSVDYYINLLQKPEFEYGMGNVTTFYKPGDGTVTLTLYPLEHMDPEPEFKTTVDNLIKIIKDWDFIHKQKFPKVLMTVDGDKVTFEPIEGDGAADH